MPILNLCHTLFLNNSDKTHRCRVVQRLCRGWGVICCVLKEMLTSNSFDHKCFFFLFFFKLHFFLWDIVAFEYRRKHSELKGELSNLYNHEEKLLSEVCY